MGAQKEPVKREQQAKTEKPAAIAKDHVQVPVPEPIRKGEATITAYDLVDYVSNNDPDLCQNFLGIAASRALKSALKDKTPGELSDPIHREDLKRFVKVITKESGPVGGFPYFIGIAKAIVNGREVVQQQQQNPPVEETFRLLEVFIAAEMPAKKDVN